MTKQQIDSTAASNTERLQKCAVRAREADRLASEAEVEATRLRKEMKRARKSYREAKSTAKDAAKEAKKAQAELSECLNEAFRDLAIALQQGEIPQAKPTAGTPSAITQLQTPVSEEVPSQSTVETQQPAAA